MAMRRWVVTKRSEGCGEKGIAGSVKVVVEE